MSSIDNEWTFEQYRDFTDVTAVYPEAGKKTIDGLLYATLGLAGEAGELANQVKKILRDDKGLITQKRMDTLEDELGDVLWYVARIATELNLDIDAVVRMNVTKLGGRLQRGVLHGDGGTR